MAELGRCNNAPENSMLCPYLLPPSFGQPSRRAVLASFTAALLTSTARPVWSQTVAPPFQEQHRPPGFASEYIEGAIGPFSRTAIYQGEPLSLPMIELAFSKQAAIPPHLWGMLYDGWRPAMEEEGVSVFFQGLGNRGPDNARKRIYMTALTPDLYSKYYRPKVQKFLDHLFASSNEGVPLMRRYY